MYKGNIFFQALRIIYGHIASELAIYRFRKSKIKLEFFVEGKL